MSAVTWWRHWSSAATPWWCWTICAPAIAPRSRPACALIVADLADTDAVDALLADGPWDAVFHFAALSQVGESMRLPFRYLIDNGANGMRLIEACVRHGVSRFVLSSTAALYGTPTIVPIPEDAPLDPESPYGDSKWFLERALLWAERVHGLRYASLRYFNAAGADPAGRLGEDHRPETHLIPLVIDAALGRRAELDVYGNDYTTPGWHLHPRLRARHRSRRCASSRVGSAGARQRHRSTSATAPAIRCCR